MEEQLKYYRFSRDQWKRFYRNGHVPLTAENLREIKAFNDRISIEDVREIYLPVAPLLQAKFEHYLSWRETESVFLQLTSKTMCFLPTARTSSSRRS